MGGLCLVNKKSVGVCISMYHIKISQWNWSIRLSIGYIKLQLFITNLAYRLVTNIKIVKHSNM